MQSWENISDFWHCGLKSHTSSRPDPFRLLFQRVRPTASGEVSLPVGANRPLTTTNLLHKHPEPITINPTPGNRAQPQACTKPSLSITGKVTAQQISPFLPHKSSKLLNNYVLELGLFLKRRHQQQAATLVGAWAFVEDGGGGICASREWDCFKTHFPANYNVKTWLIHQVKMPNVLVHELFKKEKATRDNGHWVKLFQAFIKCRRRLLFCGLKMQTAEQCSSTGTQPAW